MTGEDIDDMILRECPHGSFITIAHTKSGRWRIRFRASAEWDQEVRNADSPLSAAIKLIQDWCKYRDG